MMASAGTGLGVFASGAVLAGSAVIGGLGSIYTMTVGARDQLAEAVPEEDSQIDDEEVSASMKSFSDFSDTSLAGDEDEEEEEEEEEEE
jgi:hypothetical protein